VIYDLEHKETKSDTLTFRIEHGVVNDLRSESIEKGESLNVLMNQILKDYVSYYKPAKKAGNIHFPRVLISRLFDNLSYEKIEIIVQEHMGNDPQEQMNIFKQDFTLSVFISMLRDWLNASDFPFTQSQNSSGETITVRLDMGRKYSAFFGRCMELLCRRLNVINPKVEVTNNTVMFTVPLPRNY
jgi:hypothetical protein